MYKMVRGPEQSSYAVQDGSEVVATQLDGGSGRYRRDIMGATSRVICLWQVGPDDYKYIRAFFNSATAKGSEPFLIDLILDSADLDEFQAYFIPNTMKLQKQQGLTYYVYAELEVTPNDPDTDYDLGLVALYEIMNPVRFDAYLLALEQLVNEDIPDATE